MSKKGTNYICHIRMVQGKCCTQDRSRKEKLMNRWVDLEVNERGYNMPTRLNVQDITVVLSVILKDKTFVCCIGIKPVKVIKICLRGSDLILK